MLQTLGPASFGFSYKVLHRSICIVWTNFMIKVLSSPMRVSLMWVSDFPAYTYTTCGPTCFIRSPSYHTPKFHKFSNFGWTNAWATIKTKNIMSPHLFTPPPTHLSLGTFANLNNMTNISIFSHVARTNNTNKLRTNRHNMVY